MKVKIWLNFFTLSGIGPLRVKCFQRNYQKKVETVYLWNNCKQVLVEATKDEFRTLLSIYDEAFCKTSEEVTVGNYFLQNVSLLMFDRVLITPPKFFSSKLLTRMLCIYVNSASLKRSSANQWSVSWWLLCNENQRQPSRGVLRKSSSENMHQIYRRTPMPKRDFNKVAKQLYWNQTSASVFSCKFAAYFQNTFY